MEFIERIRQLAKDWEQEADYCNEIGENTDDYSMIARGETWYTASDYLLNFAADLELELEENNNKD